jgi:ribose transport system permease protein
MTVSEIAGVEAKPSERSATRSTRFLRQQEATLLAVIVVIGGVTAIRNSSFLDTDNLVEILRSSVIYFVMGCGAALLVIGGGLDFSVGAVFTFGALSSTKLMVEGVPVGLAILAGLLAGAVLGALNHAVITYLHVPPIIATLGTYFIVLGVDARMTGGLDVLPLPDGFQALGQGQVLWVPNVIWYAIITGICFWFLLEHTRFGVNVRALGGNRQAAIGNGLKVVRLDLVLYCLAGLTGALGGIIYSARVGAGQVQAGGSATTLTVITAVLIGGVSLLGGLGSITGVAVGAVLLSVIDNALIVARIPPSWNNVVVGAVLIAAVAVDHLRRQQLYKKK